MESHSHGAVGWGQPSSRHCPECGALFERKLVRFEFEGEDFGYFPADVCANGHEYFPQESRERVQLLARALGLWGLGRAATTLPSVYGETRDIDFPLDASSETSTRATFAYTSTIPISGFPVRRKIASVSM